MATVVQHPYGRHRRPGNIPLSSFTPQAREEFTEYLLHTRSGKGSVRVTADKYERMKRWVRNDPVEIHRYYPKLGPAEQSERCWARKGFLFKTDGHGEALYRKKVRTVKATESTPSSHEDVELRLIAEPDIFEAIRREHENTGHAKTKAVWMALRYTFGITRDDCSKLIEMCQICAQ